MVRRESRKGDSNGNNFNVLMKFHLCTEAVK